MPTVPTPTASTPTVPTLPDAPHATLPAMLDFVRELDRLKRVERRTSLIDRSRRENTAEHSWHLAVMVLAFRDVAPADVDLARAIELLLVHDIVEIDAGDTFAYDVAANVGKAEREQAAATRLFGLLPAATGAALRGAWEEFEANETPTARFANALDRFQGLLLNDAAGDGGTWRAHGVTKTQLLARMQPIATGAPALWPETCAAMERAVMAGHVRDG